MKYVVLILIIAILIRIDVVMKLFDEGLAKIQNRPIVTETAEIKREPVVVAIPDDQTLKVAPRTRFLNLLGNFKSSPDSIIRLQAMEEFKLHPTMFSKTLDKGLEGAIFSWRDLIVQRKAELPLFLLDLNNVLQGENQDIIKRFFAVMLDINLEMFLGSYSKTKDQNCMIVTLVGDPISEEEKFNELIAREEVLQNYLKRENLDPFQKNFANNCHMVLKLHLAKLNSESVAPTLTPTVAPSDTLPTSPLTPESQP